MRLLSLIMESIWDPQKLIDAREAIGLKVKDAADSLNIVPEYLSMLENSKNGKKQPSPKLIYKMTILYKRPAAFFLRAEHQIVVS